VRIGPPEGPPVRCSFKSRGPGSASCPHSVDVRHRSLNWNRSARGLLPTRHRGEPWRPRGQSSRRELRHDTHRLGPVSGACNGCWAVAVVLPAGRSPCALHLGPTARVSAPLLLRPPRGKAQSSARDALPGTRHTRPRSREGLPLQGKPAAAAGFHALRAGSGSGQHRVSDRVPLDRQGRCPSERCPLAGARRGAGCPRLHWLPLPRSCEHPARLAHLALLIRSVWAAVGHLVCAQMTDRRHSLRRGPHSKGGRNTERPGTAWGRLPKSC
jgi:hypothetical protein